MRVVILIIEKKKKEFKVVTDKTWCLQRGGQKKNNTINLRHRPVTFICQKAVIFLYSIFTASDLKKKRILFIAYC